MEDAGAQVANPIPIHQSLAVRFCSTQPMAKKRDPPFHPSNFVYQNHSSDNWNPKSWDWDSSRFVAKPVQSDGFLVGSGQRVQTDFPGRMDVQNSSPNARNPDNTGEEDEHVRLKLGDRNAAGSSAGIDLVEEPQAASRPNKRVRSGSPGGNGAKYPMCQVDNCREDLSSSKDYHRRHKVCEVHSKSSQAMVGKQMQRFCQQCSRFHLLSEFDEGKRSCRRRLAGHNRRRRKTQPEDTTQSLLVPNNRDNNANCSFDIVNLLAVLACAQGNHGDKSGKIPSIPDKDKLIQILSTINSLPLTAELASKLPRMDNKNASIPSSLSSENQSRVNGNVSSPSTMDFLAALSAAPGATSSDAFEMHSGPSTEGSDSEKTKSPHVDQVSRANFQKVPIKKNSPGGEGSCASYRHPLDDSDCHVHDTSPSLTLQLFSSSGEDDSVRKLKSGGRNYLSSESSSPSEGRSPLLSPPIAYNLFPMHTSKETVKHDHLSTDTYAKTTISNGCSTSLHLFGASYQATENVPVLDSPYHAGYTSSGSDRSPSSMTSDVQDRTGRIVFKLFDKDPGHLPGSLRAQIYNWLSNSPSEMESYIKPGCVVLSLYLSMPSFAWEQLEENLLNYLKCLVKDIDVEFWGNGRFLVHTDKQIASHKDGRIRLCKSWKAWSTPELISISPVAVVGGQETSLLMRGRRLTASGTKIHCSHAAEYDIRPVSEMSHQDTVYDEISLDNFKIQLAESSVLGRCFIEVENNFRGSSFPVIVADNRICQELRLLEPEINGIDEVCDGVVTDPSPNTRRPRSKEEVLHFLNELGWLFQRKHISSLFGSPEYKLSRFQFLLVFSVEQDFCAVVKTLLGILLEFNLGREGLARESLKMLAESYLLTKAVKRRCRRMVDMLIHYSVIDPTDGSDKFIFVPNMAGPDGITPLHLAACTLSSDDMVDALTNDPQEIGLGCWNSSLDANGLSPYAYAVMRNNNSYNSLVSQKIADRKNSQVSVLIDSETEKISGKVEKAKKNVSDFSPGQRSCSKCTLVAGYRNRIRGAQGLLQRPYIHSMLVIAAVCVCVCVFLRSRPDIGNVEPFAWENLSYGSS